MWIGDIYIYIWESLIINDGWSHKTEFAQEKNAKEEERESRAKP